MTRDDINGHPLYVRMTDKFMSRLAEHASISNMPNRRVHTNVLVLPCRDGEEADIVEANALGRSDMQRVQICTSIPRERDGILYSYHDWTDYKSWYEPGRWVAS